MLFTLLLACMEPLDPSLEIGTGETAFELLEDGDDGVVVEGPQGGHHLVVGLRATGIEQGSRDDLLDPDNPTFSFQVFRGEERLGGFAAIQGLGRGEERGVFEVFGRLLILQIEDDTDVVGDTLSVEAVLTDVDGVEVSDVVSLEAVAAPTNSR